MGSESTTAAELPPAISVVIPCYNEEDGIAQLRQTLETLDGLMKARGETWELVLVNDGSKDATLVRLQQAFSDWPHVVIANHPQNRGVGAAMRTGFAHAKGDIITCYDADCAYPVADLLTLVDAVRSGAHVASATPFVPGGSLEGVPLHRRVLSQGVAELYRAVLGGPAGSIQTFSCAFRAYRRDALFAIHFDSDGFPAASEILARLVIAGFRIVEVPSTLSDRKFGVSKMRKLETIRAHLKLLARFAVLRLERFRPRR